MAGMFSPGAVLSMLQERQRQGAALKTQAIESKKAKTKMAIQLAMMAAGGAAGAGLFGPALGAGAAGVGGAAPTSGLLGAGGPTFMSALTGASAGGAIGGGIGGLAVGRPNPAELMSGLTSTAGLFAESRDAPMANSEWDQFISEVDPKTWAPGTSRTYSRDMGKGVTEKTTFKKPLYELEPLYDGTDLDVDVGAEERFGMRRGLPRGGGNVIRVRVKSTGEEGTIPFGEYDPSIYDRL